MLWRQGRGRTPANVLSDMAAVFFRRALAVQPSFALAGLNLAETLESGGLRAEAIGTARQTLQTIQRAAELDHDSREGMPLCQPFDCFHVEWERAAWTAGRPEDEGRAKRDLLLWKLNSLLAAWTGELSHAYEAAVRRPDLASSLASLGAALVRNNQGRDALEHLRRALSANPLDRESARGCFQVLGNTGDADGRERLCEDRRLLSRAAPQVIPLENWFAARRPRGNELVSIIVLCDERLDCTRRCLESLLNHSRPPYELILVHNGSGPDSRSFLEEFRRSRGAARVEMIHTPDNQGFAGRCNRGLATARGRFVCFLDGSSVVTVGWLDCLVGLALHDWPSAGLVGPMTNLALPPQAVRMEEGLAGLDDFAAQYRRGHAGLMFQVNRLSGFCLLAARDVLDHVGGLDERFGAGLYADADLFLRFR